MKKVLLRRKLLLLLILLTSFGVVNTTMSSCGKDVIDAVEVEPEKPDDSGDDTADDTGDSDDPELTDPIDGSADLPDLENSDYKEDSEDPDEEEGLEQGYYDKLDIAVASRRENAVYSVNEPIYFDIQAQAQGASVVGSVNYTLTNDGYTVLKEGTVPLNNGKAEILFEQNEPMIVRCSVVYNSKNNKKFSALAAVAVSPFDIETTVTEPDDFKSYWNDLKVKLKEIPINAKLREVEPGLYDITLDNINGTNVHAYLGIPSGGKPSPAILAIPGAGVSEASLSTAKKYRNEGFLVLSISVHDLPNGQSKQFYSDQNAGPLKQYLLQGREHRDTYYLRRVILGCIRSIDYLTSHPQWDQKHMVVTGSSQGGGLTLVTTSLDKRVSAAAVNVPSSCEHNGKDFGRPSGGPKLVPMVGDKLDPTILKVAAYYDAVNFARYIDVPVVFGVGLLDNTCAPTSVFSAYNQLKGSKEIDIAPLMGHAFSPVFVKMRDSFIAKHGGK